MKRREFIGCASAASAAVLTGEAAVFANPGETEQRTAVKCKIVVIKKLIFKDLYEKYSDREGSICSRFEEGQEFIVTSPYNPPEKFCAWAWADIRSYIHSVYFGGAKSSVGCCTDGYRPVVFSVERIED